MSPPRILLLSAYAAPSHRAWGRRLLEDHPHVEWDCLELPGRHFRWRIRGNPLSWLDALPEVAPDAVLATSMVDLATLRGLQPVLAHTPAIYYFHENQFAYPVSARQVDSVEPQMVQLYGALAADRIAFNSEYNRTSFLDGVEALLTRMPDHVPRGVTKCLAAKACLCPVPIDPIAAGGERDPDLIVWNHRWEYDKDPDLFAEAMLELAAREIDFRLALLGPRPRTPPTALRRLRAALPERIAIDTHADATRYREVLGRAGIVVSTARQEFQGLAVFEAVSAGATPLVPDALAYREQYPEACRYPPGDREALVTRLAAWLRARPPGPNDVSAWTREALRPSWRRLLGLE
jgi:glycosyltransferase involved in cell wall biosynthesis